ncbi:MAG TPA: hypothetical protein VH186_16570, partial [Chloroflexia bacterium]|nr:hypothetical protein [Chloroflexia bacterium]
MAKSILRLRLFLITVLLTTALLWPNLTASQMALPAKAATPVPLIIDTDIYNGLDDAGALAVAHSLMNKGEANLLGVVVDTDNSYSARCVDAI